MFSSLENLATLDMMGSIWERFIIRHTKSSVAIISIDETKAGS
jgi:hypothetical protein